jgi:hypothetical protein
MVESATNWEGESLNARKSEDLLIGTGNNSVPCSFSRKRALAI